MASPSSEINENDINITNVYSVIADSHCATYERLNKLSADDTADGNIYLRINPQPVHTDNIGRHRREIEETSRRQVWFKGKCVLICCVVIALLAGTIIASLVTVVATNSRSNSEQKDQKAESTTARVTTTTTETETASTDVPFWTTWGGWTACTVTCGKGKHQRYRTCNTNTNISGRCLGQYVDQEMCNMSACSVYGSWTTWESWTRCDVTCSGGSQSRYRTCNKVNPSDLDCIGNGSQSQVCANWDCPDCTKTCVIGELNADCDACICEENIVTGRITATGTGNAISAATIFASSAPTRPLGLSDKNGFFNITDTCMMTQLLVSRDGFIDAIVDVTDYTVQVTMDGEVTPYFIEIPQSKSRLTGDDVTLCCQAKGVPDISYYEWFKDSRLLPMSLYPDGTQLLVSGLTTLDSGQFSCRANSPIGSIMSPSVPLLVKGRSDDFCADALRPKSISLPSDCIQQDTNSTLYDVGECVAKKCVSTRSNQTLACQDFTKSCCTMRTANIQTVQCSGFELLVIAITSCGCGDCSSPPLYVEGIAKCVTTDDPLKFGEVWVNGKLETYTSFTGRFNFFVSNNVDRLVLTLKDRYFNMFLDAVKVVRVSEDTRGTVFITINMLRSTEPISIVTNIENTLTSGPNTASSEPMLRVEIPSNAFTKSDGSDFNGTAQARLTFLDTTNASQLEDVPGEFQFVNEEGQTRNLKSLGVFNIHFEDESANPLSLNEPIDIHIPTVVGANVSTQNFKLWKLNLNTGNWESVSYRSVSTRKKRTTEWIGSIDQSSPMSPWYNIDKISDSENECFFKLRVYKDKDLNEEVILPSRPLHADIIKVKDGILDAMYGNGVSYPSAECMMTLCEGNEGFITIYYNATTVKNCFMLETRHFLVQ